MGYTKNDPPWSEGEAPGISAARLNHLETQFEEFQKLFNAATFLYATNDNDPEAKTRAEILALLSGQAAADFSMNSKKLTNLLDPATDQDADTKAARVAAIAAHAALTVHLVSGLILMWHGTIANIPSGWVICDGNNGTPNLLGKFVEGVATAETDPGATGGATGKTTAGHGHSGSCGGSTSNSSSSVAGSGLAKADHKHSIGVGSNTDSIADIRPLFYDIAFIMKT